MSPQVSTILPSLTYYQKGAQPALLIHSGTHGDEAGVITSLRDYLFSHAETLPDFVWVPEVSPSAVASGVRRNSRGLDVNRKFGARDDEEMRANLEIIHSHPYTIFISFHEDTEFSEFYMYDSEDSRRTPGFQKVWMDIRAAGVGMYNGIDDANDPALGHTIVDGYCVEHLKSTPVYDSAHGSVSEYLAYHVPSVRRMLTPEIPSRATREQKNALVALLMEYVSSL